MHVSVETTGGLGRRITVAVPAERLEKEFSERLKRLSKRVKLPGFRPGKIPMKIMEVQYGGQVLQEVASDLIQTTFYEAVGQQGLKPAGGPTVEPKRFDRGQDFEYVATFEVYPEIKQLELAGKEVERPVTTVADEDVARTIETLRRQQMTWKTVERAAADGDRLIIDFEGKINGEAFEGNKAQNFPVVMGSGALIEGFEQGLLGAKANDERQVAVTFPADYRNAVLAGKAVDFAVKVKEVTEPLLPEIDSEFAKRLGVADGNVDALKQEVRNNLEREATDRTRQLLRQKVFKALVEANPVDVPQALVDAEAARLLRLNRASLEAQGVTEDRLPKEAAVFRDQARQRVVLGLILAEIVKARELKAEAGKVRARLEQMAATYEQPEEFLKWYYGNPERLAEIESAVLEDEIVDLLLQGMTVKDKSMGFQALMQAAD